MPRDRATRGMLGRMREATRLTRAGQLTDATALIQRALRGHPHPPAGTAPNPAPERVAATVIRTEPTGRPRPTRVDPPAPADPVAPRTRPAGTATTGAGRFVSDTLTNRAGTRAYKLYIPGGGSDTAMPLVV
ncbi:MAG TPA: hypothetical protein VK875_09565, partial [Euzebyales bacterium]|nr:hypothetical protein [Euzebyales bacterium]